MGFNDILLYWLVIKKRLWLIIILVASTAGAILAFSYMQPEAYVAKVKFRVVAPPPADVSLFTGRDDMREDLGSTLSSFVDVLTSRSVARQVVDTLDISMSSSELQSLILIEEVIVQLESKSTQNSGLIEVSVTHSDPELAAQLTNTLMDVALKNFGEIRARSKTQSKEFIASQLGNTWQDLRQTQENLISFQIENRIGDLPQAINLQQNLIYELRQKRDIAFAEDNLKQVANYDQLIVERETELQDMVQLGLEYARLETAVDEGKSTYGFLSGKVTEATLKENETLTLGFIEIGSPADVPSSPLPRIKTSILSLGVVLSLVIGVMVAFLWNYFENSSPPSPPSKSTEKVEQGNLTPASLMSQ